ncbi:MAG: TRAP transporter substrate-binding protein [Agathobaculum sp.]|uniref:TRAP transporter substrate-binding protein n=1 Tax=Agathobaculum sp. TaxID=2048138 RepID=UPI003D918B1D
MKKTTMKKLLAMFTAATMVLTMAACGGGKDEKPDDQQTPDAGTSDGGDAASEIVLKYADINSVEHPKNVVAEHFMDAVEERTEGRIKFERFYDSSIGSAREIAEAMMQGAVDMMAGGSGDASVYAPVMEILTNGPYLYDSPEHGEAVLREVWDDVTTMLRDAEMQPLFPYYMGTRQLVSKKPIRTFEDFQGLRKRTLETPFFIDMFRAMGGSPSPTAFSEVYTALQTGVVDAAGGDAQSINLQKWYEQAKYLTKYDLIRVQTIMVMSKTAFDKLPDDLKEIVNEVAWEQVAWANEMAAASEEEVLDQLAEQGVEIIELPDEEKQKFKDSLSTYTADYAQSLGDDVKALYDKMIAVEVDK